MKKLFLHFKHFSFDWSFPWEEIKKKANKNIWNESKNKLKASKSWEEKKQGKTIDLKYLKKKAGTLRLESFKIKENKNPWTYWSQVK